MSLNVKPLTRDIYNKFKDNFDCGNLRLNSFFSGSVHINCFALGSEYHGLLQDYDRNVKPIKLSDFFFRECIENILSMRSKIGFSFITLSSTNEGYNLYKRTMFDDLEIDMFIAEKDMEQNGCIPMYYSIDIENF